MRRLDFESKCKMSFISGLNVDFMRDRGKLSARLGGLAGVLGAGFAVSFSRCFFTLNRRTISSLLIDQVLLIVL